MRENTSKRLAKARGSLFALICVSLIAAGCSKSDKNEQAEGVFDTSHLPRLTGSKEIFASPAVTNFTTPVSVAQTADTLDKALAAAGWQKYIAPNTAYSQDTTSRSMSLKKGAQALNVFITVAQAQNNATSVQYSGRPLKTDLPFTKDASDIEYSPDRPLLTLVTGEPVEKILDFYRKELGARGWSLWSEKLDAKQPAEGHSGVIHDKGGYAHYVTDKEPSVALVLTIQNADAEKSKVELKEWPVGILASLHKAYLNGGTNTAKQIDVSTLPRLEGAVVKTENSSSDRLSYTVLGPVQNTIAATKKLLAAEGWQEYVAPLEEPRALSLTLKKGAQGLSIFFTMPAGEPVHSGVDYSTARLGFALPIPEDATDTVFDENRPYLNVIASGTVDSNLDFFKKQLAATGWSPLSAKDAATKWPNAKFDENIAKGAIAYYVSENQRPIVLLVQCRDDGKINAEIKVPPFALPQSLEADQDIFGLPRPKPAKTSGGTGGPIERELHAHVNAEIGPVLAFYRRELLARNWKEEAQGAVVNPDQVVLNFWSEDKGTAVLKLGHKYDFTVVSLVQKLPKPPVKTERPAMDDSVDTMMKQAQQMVRDAAADAIGNKMNALKTAPASNGPVETLRPLAGNDAPLPLPESAEDIEIASGRLEFTATSSVTSVAEFYRFTMKQQGWQAQPSVINNANMVVLNFSKDHKAVSFTIMKMGNTTNVSADGSALKVAAGKLATPNTALQSATEDDLVAEESGGLPVPKRHTLSDGAKTPFRRELNANVPLDLAVVLSFYRRELTKLNWKEESQSAEVAADKVNLAYTSPDGPALLTLGRKDGETIVSLAVKNPDAAAKAGVIPKSGQAKVLVTNPNEVEAVITINKQTIKIAAGAGTKGPDGAMLDLAPGKYKFSIKLAGKAASNDELKVGADETWGLLIGPGGALPMHVY
jgi:hypothetical protein